MRIHINLCSVRNRENFAVILYPHVIAPMGKRFKSNASKKPSPPGYSWGRGLKLRVTTPVHRYLAAPASARTNAGCLSTVHFILWHSNGCTRHSLNPEGLRCESSRTIFGYPFPAPFQQPELSVRDINSVLFLSSPQHDFQKMLVTS